MDHHLAQGQLLFNKNPQKISQGEPARESQETTGAGQMLHHLGNGEQPNADFEKAKQRSKNFPPACDENRSDRRQSDHDGLGQKYQGGQIEDCGNNGAVRQSHGVFSASGWFWNRTGENGP